MTIKQNFISLKTNENENKKKELLFEISNNKEFNNKKLQQRNETKQNIIS